MGSIPKGAENWTTKVKAHNLSFESEPVNWVFSDIMAYDAI